MKSKIDDFINIEVNSDMINNYQQPFPKNKTKEGPRKGTLYKTRLDVPEAKTYLFQGVQHKMKDQDPEKLIANFDPTPSRKVQQKIDYFYMSFPDQKYTISKSMKFHDDGQSLI